MTGDRSTLKLVRIGRPLDPEAVDTVGRRILDALGQVIRELRILQYEPPAVERIEASLLSQALDQGLGGHILGITDIDLLDSSGPDFFKFLFGCKDSRNDVAMVSTRRLKSREPGRSLSRLVKVALHELGHNFGLVHHYSFQPAGNNGCCPMTKGTYNRHGERSYVRSVIDSRGLVFCDDCRGFLERVHGAARA